MKEIYDIQFIEKPHLQIIDICTPRYITHNLKDATTNGLLLGNSIVLQTIILKMSHLKFLPKTTRFFFFNDTTIFVT